MPQFLEWIASNLFIVVIIVGALFSVFGKKKGRPNGGPEPFGGRGASAQGRPAAPSLPAEEQGRRSPFGREPLPADSRADVRRAESEKRLDERTGRTDLEQAARQMHEEIEKRMRESRLTQRRIPSVPNAVREMDRTSSRGTGNRPQTAASYRQVSHKETSAAVLPTAQLFDKPTANDLRKGILWAEILGAPRSRKPYSSRRR
ncbi:hypothetical protein [Saccharibacillus qingshengii]|uniref:hypothetical protein n=1 Tax=Saccharibacillus qingshengii TaxID=1763540 RepID=UPI001551E5B5|nr:hypothetical protein [Saccharibacillus qingshengii]